MAVKVRLSRAGAKRHAYYRVVVSDSRSPRDGRFIEQIGTYDPNENPSKLNVDSGRLDHWLKVGALPTETLKKLILKLRQATPAQS
ncbi:MAG: 30S ribosomal protein S16 [Deltaproteobacteria bacterium]|nr:30S ribosomal protein S16 [Deltaproteobacteria bacterium]